MPTYSKNEIWERKSAIDRCEQKERHELLKEHTAKYNALKKQLQEDCIASGVHKMKMCHGDMNGPNFAGQWPYSCFHCGMFEYRD